MDHLENLLRNIPESWVIIGELPKFINLFTATEEALQTLSEDILQINHPSGEVCIDVGWLPDGDRNGRFKCVLIADSKWESPLELLITNNHELMLHWLTTILEDIII